MSDQRMRWNRNASYFFPLQVDPEVAAALKTPPNQLDESQARTLLDAVLPEYKLLANDLESSTEQAVVLGPHHWDMAGSDHFANAVRLTTGREIQYCLIPKYVAFALPE